MWLSVQFVLTNNPSVYKSDIKTYIDQRLWLLGDPTVLSLTNLLLNFNETRFMPKYVHIQEP